MSRAYRELEPMCETSEPGERLISREELLPISLAIGQRILEVFGYQKISGIVFRLRSTKREIDGVVNGEKMPTSELLLGIRKVTGASIDWILTGLEPRYVGQVPPLDQAFARNTRLASPVSRRERSPIATVTVDLP